MPKVRSPPQAFTLRHPELVPKVRSPPQADAVEGSGHRI